MFTRIAPMALAGILLASCTGSDDSPAICDVADEWRSAAQEFETLTNSVDRRSEDGLREMNDSFGVVANITLPHHDESTIGHNLTTAMGLYVDTAEWWLAQGSLWTMVTQTGSSVSSSDRLRVYDDYEAARLEMNSRLRQVNTHLQGVCHMEPVRLYESRD